MVRIVNSKGTSYGIYRYDAWGNILYHTDNEVLNANPLRYRGYVFDQDTELYYLQSRYYDPQIGRFINADAYVSTGQGLLGNNMFAYCMNNPSRYLDSCGTKNEDSTDPDENDGGAYRFLGIGFQGEFSVGCYEIGIEIIIYTDPLVCDGNAPQIAIYTYEGAFVDIVGILTSTEYSHLIEKLVLAATTNYVDEANAEALLISLQTAIFKDVGVSGSLLFLFGNDLFQTKESYNGPFDTYSGTLNYVKLSYSTSVSCKVIGIGASTERWGASFGQSYYEMLYG